MTVLDEIPAKCQDSIILKPFPQIEHWSWSSLGETFSVRAFVAEVFHLFWLPGYNVQQLHWSSSVLHHRQNCGALQTSFGLHLTRQ